MNVVRAVPIVTAGILVLPVAAGLAGTILPAFGYLPAIGGHAFGLEPWRRLVDHPGFTSSLALTLGVGLVTPVLSLLFALGIGAWAHERRAWRRFVAWCAPILATPHSALAIGLAFLLAPSGWIVRAVSPWFTGWTLPPDVATVNDPHGIALALGLMVKEVPYLVLMLAGALGQVRAREQVALARTLGYDRVTAWVKVVLPQIYPQIRLPVLAVLVFSLSVVDVAQVLGPGNPPPLAVVAVRWFADADIGWYFPGAAAALLVAVIALAAVVAWQAAERLVAAWGRRWIARGERSGVAPAAVAGAMAAMLLLVAGLAAMTGMAVWSLAAQWRFPDAWPAALTLATWSRRAGELAGPAVATLGIGMMATLLALTLVVGCLEAETGTATAAGRRGRGRRLSPLLVYAPLLVPQVAFLFGAQVLLVRTGADGTWVAVILTHLVFVLPYLYLSLADPWRALDPRYARAAHALGAGRWRTLWRIRAPLLRRPLLVASAVGFTVSVGQYLPTLFAGNGQVATLTTEAVTLASGADRRLIGVVATAQAALPALAYCLAVLVPARRGEGRT